MKNKECSLRQLIIESLTDALAKGKCEWEAAFPEGLPIDVPIDDKGYIQYSRIPRSFVEKQNDETLFRLYTANCCLAFR